MKVYQLLFLSLILCLVANLAQGDEETTASDSDSVLQEETPTEIAERNQLEASREALQTALGNLNASNAQILKEMSVMLEALDRQLGPSMVDLSEEIAATRYHFNRGMIGVFLGEPTDAGVLVDEVIEGGPAQQAGIESGDVITAIDGAVIKDFDDPRNSAVSLLRKSPGTAVRVQVQRDGEFLEKTMETVHSISTRYFESWTSPDVAEPLAQWQYQYIPDYAPSARFRAGFTGLEKANSIGIMEIEEELGYYFGVDYGVLILTAEDDSPLQVGDVLLEIDENPVRSASHARQHASQATGTIDVKVKRKKRDKTVTVDADDLRFRPVLANRLIDFNTLNF